MPDRQPSLMRALGLAAGDLWRTIRGQPAPPTTREVRREVEERRVPTDEGEVTLRRTVIEEVEVRRGHRAERDTH